VFPDIANILGGFPLAPVLRDLEEAPRMKVDIEETDQAYILRADVPGADREDITVTVDGNTVTIVADVVQEKVRMAAGLILSERLFGEEQRVFTLPVEIDESRAEARIENGVLLLKLPKQTGIVRKKLDIRQEARKAPLQEQYARGTGQGLPATPGITAATVNLKINGTDRPMQIESRVTLLDALREYAHLYGTKKGCDLGQCGACTVHVDGRRVLSCLTLACQVEGQEVTTIEGLATDGRLHAIQDAFLRHDAFQCGYCTPGQIMSAIACITEGHANSDASIREYMSGNLCRCGAYTNIVAAVREVAASMASDKEKAS
jgi:xanthine dehydrogenase YagT iron-sulfur-binding subunit